MVVAALRGEGLDPGLWQAAVFVAEELSQATPEGAQTLLPIFLRPEDVRAAYARAGIDAKALERVQVPATLSTHRWIEWHPRSPDEPGTDGAVHALGASAKAVRRPHPTFLIWQVLELRQLLQLMMRETPDAVNPWRAVQFIASPAALELAHELAQ